MSQVDHPKITSPVLKSKSCSYDMEYSNSLFWMALDIGLMWTDLCTCSALTIPL